LDDKGPAPLAGHQMEARSSTREEPPLVGLASWEEMATKVVAFNRKGMSLLRQGDPEDAVRLFESAQELLDRVQEPAGGGLREEEQRRSLAQARADTASNLGICHRRTRNLVAAAKCLNRALRLYKAAGASLRTQVAAHLNLAACHLEAQAPETALRHAKVAVDLAGQLVASLALEEDIDSRPSDDVEPPRSDDYAMLAVAYHKVAEAHEGLREWGQATFCYTQAYEVVRRSLGPNHHLTRSFEKSSRCPHRAAVLGTSFSPAGQKAQQKQGSTPRRLPGIPSTRPRTAGPQECSSNYELSADVFPQWPPRSSTREEHQWYTMARKPRELREQPEIPLLMSPGREAMQPGREPTLEAFSGAAAQEAAMQALASRARLSSGGGAEDY